MKVPCRVPFACLHSLFSLSALWILTSLTPFAATFPIRLLLQTMFARQGRARKKRGAEAVRLVASTFFLI